MLTKVNKANIIKNTIRVTDMFFSATKDQFVVVFPGCPKDIMEHVMKGLKERIQLKCGFKINYTVLEVTEENISEDPQELIDMACEQLNTHKKL